MMSSKKYELVNYNKFTGLYQVKYLRDIPRYNVKAGDLGGWVSSESNLSLYDDCVVLNNAIVTNKARVFDKARVSDNARVSGNAFISDNSCVSDNAYVYGNARVFGNAHVYGKAFVYGDANISSDAELTRRALNISCPELYKYNITFTDYHIQIGCMQMLYPEWLLVNEKDAKAMGLERKYYKNVKELLETTIKHYYGDKV